MEDQLYVVDEPPTARRAKSKSRSRKFDQSDRESVDSGRMSRRGNTEDGVIESDDDSVINDHTVIHNEGGESLSLISPEWRQVRGQTKTPPVAASKGKESPVPLREGGTPVDAIKDSASGDIEAIGAGLAVDSGYSDGIYSITPDCNRDAVLTGRTDVDADFQGVRWVDSCTPEGQSDCGYRSTPASRQDEICAGQGEEAHSEDDRACKSAVVSGSSRGDKKPALMQQSESSPLLGSSQQHDCYGQQENRQRNNEICREGVQNTRVTEESLPGNASRHFSDVALVSVSVTRKVKNAKQTTDYNKGSGSTSERNKSTDGSEAPSKPQAGNGDETFRRKSVTWEDMVRSTRPSCTDDDAQDDINWDTANIGSTGKEDTLKCDDPFEALGIEECSKGRTNSSPDSNEGDVRPAESAASNGSSLKELLMEIVGMIGQFKVKLHQCLSAGGRLHEDTLELCHSKYQKVSMSARECVTDPRNVCGNLSIIRTQLLNLHSHAAADVYEEVNAGLPQDEGTTSRDDQWSALQSVIQSTLVDLSKVIVSTVEAGTVGCGTAADAQDIVTLLKQVQDGTYCPSAEDSSVSVRDQCHATLSPGESVTDDASSNAEHPHEDDQSEVGSEVSVESVDRLCEWPRKLCYTQTCLGDDPIICVIHLDSDVINVSRLNCEVVDPTFLPSVTEEFETLVGKVIRITAEGAEQSTENRYLVAIPYRESLVEEWQEIEVRELTQTGEWHKKPRTHHKAVLDDLEKNSLRYVAVETDRPSTLAVVASARVDKVNFDAKGVMLTSSGDPRVSVNIAENTCYGECRMSMQVFIPDACAIHEYRLIQEDNCAFKAASPLIDMNFTEDITNPVKVTVPMMMPLKRLMRASGRPAPKPDPFNETELLLFQKKPGTDEWKCVRYARVYNVMGAPGMVKFEWFENEGRFVILCVGKEASRKTIDGKATLFLKYMTLKVAELTLLQDPTCVRKVSVSLCPKQHGVRKRRPPKEEIDFTFVTEFMMREGQPFDINLRGNLKSNWTFPTRYMNYAVEPISFSFEVGVLDNFCQRSLTLYCGFLQVLDPLQIMAAPRAEAKVKDKDNTQKVKDVKATVLAEICVRLPKPEVTPVISLVRAPLNIKLCGGVSFETLREVALQVSDEWKLLARNLRIPQARIQSIMRNTKGKQHGQIALEVLYAWLKRVPVSQDKATILCDALTRSGRPDLAETIRERDRQKKDVAIRIATEHNLKKAIVLVCRSPTVVNQWRTLAARLGLSKDDVAELDFLSMDQHNVCRMALERWQSLVSTRAEVKVLAQQLASLGCEHVAGSQKRRRNVTEERHHRYGP